MGCRSLKDIVVGHDTVVKTLTGEKPYIFFDNAASTPPFKRVMEVLSRFLPYYSNVHRGTGYKSFVSTELLEEARQKVHDFIGATAEDYSVIFVKNTTEALNKLANKLSRILKGKVVITEMEHHSNLLPWRRNFETLLLRVNDEGRLDLNRLEDLLRSGAKLVAVTGASNVTGFVNPVHEIAALAHRYGALVAVDGAQLVPHRKVEVKGKGEGDHIDFLAFSAHKMYAPFGVGVLVARKDVFGEGEPESVGGGTVKFVSLQETIWADLPEKEEAGTPNIPGAIALAASIDFLTELGMEEVERCESSLAERLEEGLRQIDGVRILGGERRKEDLPVISFVHRDYPHHLLASVLSYEEGVGVRSGCFCAQPYVKRLLGVSDERALEIKEAVKRGDRSGLPGAVRVSLGIYNTAEEVDRFIAGLKRIVEEGPAGEYLFDERVGNYVPAGFSFESPRLFRELIAGKSR